MATIAIGDLAVKTGTYKAADGSLKGLYKRIGKLQQTMEQDGTVRVWGEIDADQLNPSLASLAVNQNREDCKAKAKHFEAPRVPLQVFPPKKAPAAAGAGTGAVGDDDIPY